MKKVSTRFASLFTVSFKETLWKSSCIRFLVLIPFSIYFKSILSICYEWVSTAQNSIARQSIGQHFWQEINSSTQNFSTAWIKLNRAQPDLTSWKKVTTGRHFFLVQHINWKTQFLTYREFFAILVHELTYPT